MWKSPQQDVQLERQIWLKQAIKLCYYSTHDYLLAAYLKLSTDVAVLYP